MKKTFCMLIAMILLFITTASSAETFQSIGEVQNAVPERWAETYETKWRTIEIDVPISIPDVETMPIIRVKRKDKMDADLISDYPVIQNYTGYLVLYSDKAFYDYDPPLDISRQKLGVFSRDEIPNVTPEKTIFHMIKRLNFAMTLLRRSGSMPKTNCS